MDLIIIIVGMPQSAKMDPGFSGVIKFQNIPLVWLQVILTPQKCHCFEDRIRLSLPWYELKHLPQYLRLRHHEFKSHFADDSVLADRHD